jgi:MoxR-like ATPase
MKFKSTNNYIATDELILAVNSSITIERPLLIKGEPGTGKTQLAEELAKHLDTEIISWHIKSSSKAQHGLYEYDTVSRLRDSQFGEEKVKDISNYIKKGPLWRAFEAKKKVVLLIDEIDKADLEFPNDLLLELDKMEFFVYELQKKVRSKNRPIVIITSNNEKELPDAFLRRCFFHYIKFPDENTLKKIIEVHFPKIKSKMVKGALEKFFDVRNTPGLKKKPSTSELIDWLQLLLSDDIDPSLLNDEKNSLPSLYGALLKNEQDVEMFEKLMFISRGQK